MMWLRAGSVLSALVMSGAGALSTRAAYAETEPQLLISSTLGCVNTVIIKASEPTGSSMAAGGLMSFKSDIAPGHGTSKVTIEGVYVGPDQHTVGRAGDAVRVCLLAMPEKDDRCDPKIDPRGREFFVYDRATGNAGTYYDGEHLCGGA